MGYKYETIHACNQGSQQFNKLCWNIFHRHHTIQLIKINQSLQSVAETIRKQIARNAYDPLGLNMTPQIYNQIALRWLYLGRIDIYDYATVNFFMNFLTNIKGASYCKEAETILDQYKANFSKAFIAYYREFVEILHAFEKDVPGLSLHLLKNLRQLSAHFRSIRFIYFKLDEVVKNKAIAEHFGRFINYGSFLPAYHVKKTDLVYVPMLHFYAIEKFLNMFKQPTRFFFRFGYTSAEAIREDLNHNGRVIALPAPDKNVKFYNELHGLKNPWPIMVTAHDIIHLLYLSTIDVASRKVLHQLGRRVSQFVPNAYKDRVWHPIIDVATGNMELKTQTEFLTYYIKRCNQTDHHSFYYMTKAAVNLTLLRYKSLFESYAVNVNEYFEAMRVKNTMIKLKQYMQQGLFSHLPFYTLLFFYLQNNESHFEKFLQYLEIDQDYMDDVQTFESYIYNDLYLKQLKQDWPHLPNSFHFFHTRPPSEAVKNKIKTHVLAHAVGSVQPL